MARKWTAVLARIGTPTGDGRIIAPGALTNRSLPLPLMWQRQTGEGHGGAVVVGAIETLTIDNENGVVLGEGRFLDVRGAAEAEAQTEAGVTGPSVDLFDDVDIAEVQKLIEAGVVGPQTDMDDIEYAMQDDGLIVITQGRIAGATLVAIPAFADVSIDMADEVDGGMEAELFASAAPSQLPPKDWFERPDLDRVTPLTVTDTGRVFGHIAPWGQCHVGLPGCVTAPASSTEYAYFHQSSQRLPDGSSLPVGTMTVGGGHAAPGKGWAAAIEHYDNVGAAVAKVRAGEDEFGIWVAGWVLPQATEEQREAFASSPVSGDWRQVGGSLELVAVCSVNSAGFPVPKARVSFGLEEGQRSLVASFGVTPTMEVAEVEQTPASAPVNTRSLWMWRTLNKEDD